MNFSLFSKVVRKIKFIWFKQRAKLLKVFKTKTVKSAYGVLFKENWTDNTFNYYIRGTYGFYYSNYLKQYNKNFIFLDIGANQGLYSLLAAKNKMCRNVFSFEPVGSIASLFRENIRINRLNNITVIEKAISNSVGTVNISYNPLHTGLTSIESVNTNNDGKETVKLETVDFNYLENLLTESDLDIVCKIDVEGHELTVIQQLACLKQSKRITSILYECDSRWLDDVEVQRILASMGFNKFKRIGYGEHYDVLATKTLAD